MNYRQIYARKAECEKRIKEVCPDCPNTSGIYFLTRFEDGFKYAYVGKAKHLLERLGSHLAGYQQHIDKSLKKHGLYSEQNPTGWRVAFIECDEDCLNEQEQSHIRAYADMGFQLRNVESGGQQGKSIIGERKQPRGYFDGKEAGYLMARREVAHWFSLHLNVSMRKPTKNAEKALAKFQEFINLEAEENA